ncbi:MAG: hypothetical protein AAB434_03430 [Planctomycetota bacterium]
MTAPATLEQVRIASPCHASWNEMTGDDRVRHCQLCKLNVYNLSGMSREEAERLVQGAEGRLCVRFYQRSDGTVLTRDCPKGLAAIRKRLVIAAAALVGVFGAVTSGLAYAFGGASAPRPTPVAVTPVPDPVPPDPDPVPDEPIMGRMVMGKVCPPAQQDATTETR